MHYLHSFLKTRRVSFLAHLAFVVTACAAAIAGDAQFRAPTASIYEARIATIIQPAPKKLRLDIGASVDLFHIRIDSTRPSMCIGADFMTYTRLRSEHNLKFPVETIDYWFGVHAAYSLSNDIALRLRVAHISSHFVDGLADTAATFSVRNPFVYSREFVEVLASYAVTPFLRAYAGGTVITSAQPSRADRIIPQAGVDADIPVDDNLSIRGGYDWRLIGIEGAYVTAQAAQFGVFWNTNDAGSGIMFSVHGYNGRSMHGMFFDEAESYFGFGIQIVW